MTQRSEIRGLDKPHVRYARGEWWAFERLPSYAPGVEKFRMGRGATPAAAYQQWASNPFFQILRH